MISARCGNQPSRRLSPSIRRILLYPPDKAESACNFIKKPAGITRARFAEILFREHRVDFRKQIREGFIPAFVFVARARGADFDKSVLMRKDIDFRS